MRASSSARPSRQVATVGELEDRFDAEIDRATRYHRPLGLVMGTCVYHVAHQGLGGFIKKIGQNMEMPNYTQALYDARELAMERMQAEAEGVQAEGIVGVQLVEGSHGWDKHVIEYFAVGTAVMPTSADHTIPAPSFVLTLNDPNQNNLRGF